MQTTAKRNSSIHFEHSDVVRIIGHSHQSFDDAVATALHQLLNPLPGHDHHPDLEFKSFRVVEMGGVIHSDNGHELNNKDDHHILHYSVTIDVEGHHTHGGRDHKLGIRLDQSYQSLGRGIVFTLPSVQLF